MRRSSPVLCVLFLLALASPLAAQEGALELGVESGITITDVDGADAVTSFQLPVQRLRFGGFITDNISLESSLALNVIGNGETAFSTQFTGGIGLHLPTDPMSTRVFVAPFAALNIVDVGNVSDTQFGAGTRLGLKIPATDLLSVRVEGSYTRSVGTDELPASDNFAGIVGLSFFIR